MRTTIMISLLATALLGGAACNDKEDKAEAKFEKAQDNVKEQRADVRDEQKDVAKAQADVAAQKNELARAQADLSVARREYAASLDVRIAKIDARLTELGYRTDDNAKEAAARLRNQRNELSTKMSALGSTAESDWEAFKRDLDARFDQTEKDIDAAF